jgi:hypothetical protein
MSKLLQRLSDASKSGVYRAPHARDVLDAVRESPLRVVQISLAGVASKATLLGRIAGALAFPDWFGGNWDALEDCLGDLSWSPAAGHVLLIDGAASLGSDERGVLIDILASAASSWAERGRPFFAVFVDGAPQLPELYRSRE